jgi:AmmeMemoRadiSam system protein B
MDGVAPAVRRDLEFFPVTYEGKQVVLIRDHLGLVQEGKAIELPLYQFMTLLDGNRDLRDIQMAMMRQRGGVLVGMDEVKTLLSHLDEAFLLESESFRNARDHIVQDFGARPVRPCSHCGRAYPAEAEQLEHRLSDILTAGLPRPARPEGKVVALVSPHIDLSVGQKGYASAYSWLEWTSPSRVVVLGVGHQMSHDLFSLTEKDFETPLGTAKADKVAVRALRGAGRDALADNDFAHRAEHSIEFQVLFLQHLLKDRTFTIVPILCGFLGTSLPEFTRGAYLEKTASFVASLKEIVRENETLVVAGVDFSHVGPKFGHQAPAHLLTGRSEAHDRNLLASLSDLNVEQFWEESRRSQDEFNVCGFSALALLLEVLPECKGQVLHYETWYEEATRSAVSFAAVMFSQE